jgi:hypothetical protein
MLPMGVMVHGVMEVVNVVQDACDNATKVSSRSLIGSLFAFSSHPTT